MGRNSAIKRFSSHPSGQPVSLLQDAGGRLPVVLELLRSPWILRGSDLLEGASARGKRLEAPVDVEWDGERACPAAFTSAGRRRPVDAVAQSWTVERGWWDPRKRVSRRCFRVIARGGVYDLAYDRLTSRWLLVGVVD